MRGRPPPQDRRLHGAGDAQRQRRRATHGPAASRELFEMPTALRRHACCSGHAVLRRCIASSRRWASAKNLESSVSIPHRLCQRLVPWPASTSRTAAISFSDGLVDERRHSAQVCVGADRPCDVSGCVLASCCTRVARRNRALGIVYLQISRRRRDHFSPLADGAEPSWSLSIANAEKMASSCPKTAGSGSTSSRYRRCQCVAKQAREQGAREAWFVPRAGHRRLVVERLDVA